MSTSISDQSIKALFDAAEAPLGDDAFTASVLNKAGKLKRRIIIRRVLIGVVIFLAGIPLEDSILALSQILLVSLVEIPEGVVSQLLEPLNSVAGLLSVILVSMKVAHRKLFHR